MGWKGTDLDSFGEIYPGFDRDRQTFKSFPLKDPPNVVWRRAFDRVRATDDFYLRSDDAVARETMRIIMELLD